MAACSEDMRRLVLGKVVGSLAEASMCGDGSFSYHECLPGMPHPGLHVAGVGQISLPPSDEQLTRLRTIATQAPFGLGQQSRVDRSVRDTLEIDSDMLELRNPAWDCAVLKVTKSACRVLGTEPSGVGAKIYKLLIYEEGGHFKPHRDTEKVDGMFGTLIFQLPSQFEGGKFVVEHNGHRHEYAMGGDDGSCAHSIFAIAHYADCLHEVLPLTSGCRVALVYSLRWEGCGVPPGLESVRSGVSSLVHTLKQYRTVGEMQPFALHLEHLYTRASLRKFGLQGLKGLDRRMANALLAAQEAAKLEPGDDNLVLCLAEVEFEIQKEEEDEDDREYFHEDRFQELDEKNASPLDPRKIRLSGLFQATGDGGVRSLDRDCDDDAPALKRCRSGEDDTGNDGGNVDGSFAAAFKLDFQRGGDVISLQGGFGGLQLVSYGKQEYSGNFEYTISTRYRGCLLVVWWRSQEAQFTALEEETWRQKKGEGKTAVMHRWAGGHATCSFNLGTQIVSWQPRRCENRWCNCYNDTSTVAVPNCVVPRNAKAYYELHIVEPGTSLEAGWAEIPHKNLFLAGANEVNWSKHDVIGLGIRPSTKDSEECRISLSVNGVEKKNVAHRFKQVEGVVPAVKLGKGARLCFNCGEKPFRFPPQDTEYSPVVSFAVDH